MWQKKLTRYVYYIVLFLVAAITITTLLPLSNLLKNSLISELVGGGVIAVLIATVFFHLQETNEFQASKQKSVSFLINKLLPDLNEALERGPSPWNLSGENKFFFDNSSINPLFDVYQSNFDQINNFSAYISGVDLINVFGKFYRQARGGYVLGEKLNNKIYQLVRNEHHKKGIISANDFRVQAFIKAKLFARMQDEDSNKYLEWERPSDTTNKILKIASKDTEINNLIQELKTTRDDLIDTVNKISILNKKLQAKIDEDQGSSFLLK